jgi:LysM repeat protein
VKSYSILVLLCLLFVSCAPQPTSTPAPLPTNTPPATSTALPTATEAPTSTSTPTEAPAGTAVLVGPPSQSVNLNEWVSVDIEVDAVTNLYATDIHLSFDAGKLEVQDANTTLAGVQVEPGSFLDPGQGFVAENSADNATGAVRYVFTLTSPAPAASGGGVLARITFRAKAVGTAAVTLTQVDLVDEQVELIAATLMDGSITVLAPAGPFTYVVQPGDSLYNISLRFDVPMAAIVALNDMIYPWGVHVGQVLIIPVNLAAPQPGTLTPTVAATPAEAVTP